MGANFSITLHNLPSIFFCSVSYLPGPVVCSLTFNISIDYACDKVLDVVATVVVFQLALTYCHRRINGSKPYYPRVYWGFDRHSLFKGSCLNRNSHGEEFSPEIGTYLPGHDRHSEKSPRLKSMGSAIFLSRFPVFPGGAAAGRAKLQRK